MCSLTRPQLQLLYQRKLEALKCGPDLFWPQKSNLFNSKISSFLSRALTQTTTPIGINYISEKACEKKWNQSVLEHFPRHLIVPNQEIQWNASTHIQQAIWWQPAKSIHMPDTTSIFGAHRWARCQYTQLDRQSSQKSFKISGQGYSHLLQPCQGKFTPFTYFSLEVWLSNNRKIQSA